MAKPPETGAEPAAEADSDELDPKYVAAIQTAISHLEQADAALGSIDTAVAEQHGIDDIKEALEESKEGLTDVLP